MGAADERGTALISGEEREAFSRIAAAAGDAEATRWLGGLTPAGDEYEAGADELRRHLTRLALEGGVAQEVEAGRVARHDAGVLTAILSHCYRRHMGLDSLMDGTIAERMREAEKYL